MYLELNACGGQIRSARSLDFSSELWHTVRRQFKNRAFIVLLAQVKPQNSTERAAIRWMRSSGRTSVRDFFQGFCGPHLESGGRLRPLSLPCGNPRGNRWGRW